MDVEQKDWAFYYSPFWSNGNKAKQFFFCFVVAAAYWLATGWHLFRNPCSYTWKAATLLFWNREINKCPSDCFRIKKGSAHTHTHTHTHTQSTPCTYGCIIAGTICCTLSPHSHLFIWREPTNIIWIPIRLTLRVHTLHHHEASTVHCNLNPLFESCVCVWERDGRTVAGREIKTDSFQWSWGRCVEWG